MKAEQLDFIILPGARGVMVVAHNSRYEYARLFDRVTQKEIDETKLAALNEIEKKIK